MSKSQVEAVQANVLSLDEKRPFCWRLSKPAIYIIVAAFLVIVGTTVGVLVGKSDNENQISNVSALSNEDYQNRYNTFRLALSEATDPSGLVVRDSPQSKALDWLVYKDETIALASNTLLIDADEARLFQRYAVMVIFYALGTGVWESNSLQNQFNVHECQFYGITCNDNSRIIRLEWPFKELAGALPNEVALLTSMEHLDLNGNYLEGSIPDMLYDMTDLKVLLLQSNELTSTISQAISNLENLQELSLSSNFMTGSLPTQLGSLLNLKRLEIASNNFIGRPFDVLLNLTNLETLILDNSLFTGAIPESIDRLSNLQHLSLVDIQLTGSLPTALLTLKNLDHFAIFAKDLGGIFPENIDQLSNLELLVLHDTFLSGTMPSGIGELTKLTTLTFAGTNMSGTVPTELALLNSLTSLTLESSRFTGTLPSELSRIEGLSMFSVKGNGFFGDVEFICDIPSATYFYGCNLLCDCCLKTCNDCAKVDGEAPESCGTHTSESQQTPP